MKIYSVGLGQAEVRGSSKQSNRDQQDLRMKAGYYTLSRFLHFVEFPLVGHSKTEIWTVREIARPRSRCIKGEMSDTEQHDFAYPSTSYPLAPLFHPPPYPTF
ncbi:hypothetical protein ACTXT7_010478 [Hymenolepis weldensis]